MAEKWEPTSVRLNRISQRMFGKDWKKLKSKKDRDKVFDEFLEKHATSYKSKR